MRTHFTTLSVLAVLVASLASTRHAAAQERTPSVSVELQARLGGGVMWIQPSCEGGLDCPVLLGSNDGDETGAVALGASLSIREYRTGLGATLAYSHVFTGGPQLHYGTHAPELRASERYTLVRGEHRGHTLALSILGEVGVTAAFGGGSTGCSPFGLGGRNPCEGFVSDSVDTNGVGVVVALGVEVQFGNLLVGVEADYRYLGAVDPNSALSDEDAMVVMARVGLVFDS